MDKITQLARHGLFDAKVPRYTSYPTAPHFAPSGDETPHAAWLRALPRGGTISLYVHVPFCRRLCWFCACRTQGTQSDAPIAAYLQTLLDELKLLGATLPEGTRLSHLHWGGGTPTILSPSMIDTLAGAIAEVAPFAPGAEFSVEIDPNEVDPARLAALSAAGMNRASIGVQDFDPEIQRCIGRLQSYERTRDVVAAIRALGVRSLNADILYGLPYQSNARIADSVQKLLSLSPDRVALYGYAHVPWMARRQSLLPSAALPTPQARLDLFETARQLFTWDGYSEIGIDHFARPGDPLEIARKAGRLRRNFQGYTDDASQVLVGVGASSISRFAQGYTQNSPATSVHAKAIRDGRFSTARQHAFAGDDLLRGRIIEALMCDFEVRTDQICATHDIAPEALIAMFNTVAGQFPGLVGVTDAGLRIRPEARALTRVIARRFDAYDTSLAQHSSAI